MTVYSNAIIKAARLHGIVLNPALNDGNNGLVRIEAHQWITDKTGCVTDIRHRLEAQNSSDGFDELFRRAAKIVSDFHVELKQ